MRAATNTSILMIEDSFEICMLRAISREPFIIAVLGPCVAAVGDAKTVMAMTDLCLPCFAQ
jgi:hypothetical protein